MHSFLPVAVWADMDTLSSGQYHTQPAVYLATKHHAANNQLTSSSLEQAGSSLEQTGWCKQQSGGTGQLANIVHHS